VVAAPGPVHGQIVESLIGSISDAVKAMPTSSVAGSLTTRGWEGALRYLDNDEYALMIVVEV
ncbi:hypothetical protein V1520DRAFT_266453, partial [Lipomyces starkeyi]